MAIDIVDLQQGPDDTGGTDEAFEDMFNDPISQMDEINIIERQGGEDNYW